MRWLLFGFVVVVIFSVTGCMAVDTYHYETYWDEYGSHTVPVRETVVVPDWDTIGDLVVLGMFLNAARHTRVDVHYHYPPYRGR